MNVRGVAEEGEVERWCFGPCICRDSRYYVIAKAFIEV